MDRLSHVLPKVLQKRGLAQHAASAHITLVADRWMGERLPHLRDFVRAASLKDGTLCVTCSHSVALMECQAVADQLLQYLRVECPFGSVSAVRVSRE